MGGFCVVQGCRNKTDKLSTIRFHRFPKDPVRRRKWLFAIRRDDWLPTENSRVCSEHFSESMIDRSSGCRVRLTIDAVPTIFKKNSSKVTKKVSKPLKSNFFVIDQKLSKSTTIVVRSKMVTREAAELFVKEIEKLTNANFLIDCEMPNSQKVIFHKKWICQHSSYSKISSSELNFDCKASIDILVKKVDKQTRKNDEYLRRPIPFPSLIKVNLGHSHKTDSTDALQALDSALKAVEQFEKYFSNGVTAVEAGHLNESKLATDEFCAEANAAKNLEKSLLYHLIDEQISKTCASDSDTSYSESEYESDVEFIHTDALNEYSETNGTTSHFQKEEKVDTLMEYASFEDKREFLNEIERLMMFNVPKKKLLKLITCLKSIENECTLNEKMMVVNAIMKRQKTLNRHKEEVRCSNPSSSFTNNDKRPLFHYFTVLQDQKENDPSM